ncbi:endothelin-converting enzyme 1-like [Babylonia areolata]|uniref:endothelin-converting enzyme 1-like n=1 Tax=Babylonia areolata TaxID=304850 RepID=UPI003FD1BD14
MTDGHDMSVVGSSKDNLNPKPVTFSSSDDAWKPRSRLEKCLVVLVVLLFIAVVVFLVLFLVFYFKADEGSAAFVSESIDPSVDPCDDFYQFACGKWIERNPLTPEKATISNFDFLQEKNLKSLRDLLGQEDPKALDAVQKTRAFFRSCENTDAMDAKGTAPLLELLRQGTSTSTSSIGLFPTLAPNWKAEDHHNKTFNQILTEVGKVGGLRMSPLVAMGVLADNKRSTRNIITFSQPGLTLGSRNYYLGARNNSVLLLYQQLYVDLMTALGANHTTASQDAAHVVDFEIRVANATMPPDQRRDPEKLYNKMTVRQLTRRYPQFDWLEYLRSQFSPEGLIITMEEEVVVDALEYYDDIFNVIRSTPTRTLLNFALWEFVYPFASFLDKKSREIKSKFSRARRGVSRDKERWEVCVTSTDNSFSEVTGRLYVHHHFSPQTKSKVNSLIGDLKDAFTDIVLEADWMSEETKRASLEKVCMHD